MANQSQRLDDLEAHIRHPGIKAGGFFDSLLTLLLFTPSEFS